MKEKHKLASEEFDLQFKYMMHPYKARVTYYIIGVNKIESDLVIFNWIGEVKIYRISIFTSTLNEGIEEIRRVIDKGGFYIK